MTFTSTVLIIFAIIFLSIAALILAEHSSVARGGILYSFLPPFGRSDPQVFIPSEPPQPPEQLAYIPVENEPTYYEETPHEYYAAELDDDLMYEILAYERMVYEMMQYEMLQDIDLPEPNEYIPAQLPPIVPVVLPALPITSPSALYLPSAIYSNSPFSVVSFYLPSNSALYDYFHYNRPYLEKDDVVWKVNAHLHLPFYAYICTNHDPNPLLVNPFYRLPYGFTPHQLVPVNNADCNLRGTPEAVAAFRLLRESAAQDGFALTVTSAFRTAAHQHRLWERRNFSDGVVARPYHSEHQTGRALDLWGPHGLLDSRGATPTGIWVAENAHHYGFIIRYRADTTHITSYIHEPWHITYVGVAISMHMYENGILSLEEFVGRNPGATLGWGI